MAFGLLLATGSAMADAGHSNDERVYGEPGDINDGSTRVVDLAVIENENGLFFEPEVLNIGVGEQVQFKFTNKGDFEHELVIGTVEENLAHKLEMEKNPDMEHDDPNMVRLQPNQSGEVIWRFTKAGTFDYSCLLPGHRDSGMFGTIIVQ